MCKNLSFESKSKEEGIRVLTQHVPVYAYTHRHHIDTGILYKSEGPSC
jgi:hypothetical protein